jgi:hypothetical protein
MYHFSLRKITLKMKEYAKLMKQENRTSKVEELLMMDEGPKSMKINI